MRIGAGVVVGAGLAASVLLRRRRRRELIIDLTGAADMPDKARAVMDLSVERAKDLVGSLPGIHSVYG